jgi:hypothetical protein
MTRNLVLICALLSFGIFGMGCGGKNVPMNASSSVPAAAGHADIGTDSNGNTTVDLKVHHLAKPESLTPPATAYVVWIQPSGQAPQNQGQLQVNGNLDGEYKTNTSYKKFDLFVTAENNAHASNPSGPEIMRQQVNR